MFRKKMFYQFIVIFTFIFLLSGCTESSKVVSYQNNSDITTITFFGNKYETENVKVIEEIISNFMKENPKIRVSYESLKGNEYYEALEKRIKSGKTDDVFMVNHDILLELESLGIVADLSGLSTIPNYTDSMLSQMNENGSIFWVPTTVSVFGLYCNSDLLKKHKQKIPENLEEWRNVCDYFLDQGITPIIANNDISLKTLAIGKSFYSIYQNNSQKEVFDGLSSGEKALSDYLGSGFALVNEFIDKGYVDAAKTLNTKKTSDDLTEFVKGNTPFMLTGAWAAGRVDSMSPGFDFEVVPYPALDDGSFEVINADTRLSVNSESENLDAAIKFVEYFTQEENIKKFADQQSSFSPLKNGSPSSVKEIQPLISCYQSGRTIIGTDSRLNLPIWDLTADATKKLLSGEPFDDTMQWMDEQTNPEGRTP